MLTIIFYKYCLYKVYVVLIIQEKASVFSYPGYTETVKYQIGKICYQGWGAGKFFSGSGSSLFFKRLRLRLLVFFPSGSGSGSWYFFSSGSGSGSGSGSKGPKTPGSDRLRLLGKIFFSPQTCKVKLQKDIKQVK